MIAMNTLNFKDFFKEDSNLTSMLNPEIIGDDAFNRQSTDRFNISNIRNFILPTKTVRSEIRLINDKNNPILIQLLNGTKLFLSFDEYKKIKNQNPAVGKMATVVFQRHPNDKSDNFSLVNSIKID